MGIVAQLEQLKRLDKAYRDVSVSGNTYSKETARYNWDAGNEKIVGQIMQAHALLAARTRPSDEEINQAFSGVLCRCGTYQRIRRAIHRAAEEMNDVTRR